jgi:hypothetical protein
MKTSDRLYILANHERGQTFLAYLSGYLDDDSHSDTCSDIDKAIDRWATFMRVDV